ncbi:MAG: hypothetical protein ACTS6A_00605 [Candidatus Hodgkinia cicadicola]
MHSFGNRTTQNKRFRLSPTFGRIFRMLSVADFRCDTFAKVASHSSWQLERKTFNNEVSSRRSWNFNLIKPTECHQLRNIITWRNNKPIRLVKLS